MYRVVTDKKKLFDVFCMSNIRGVWVKNPHPLSFSFYFSKKFESDSSVIPHGPRVKVAFNPNKVKESQTGILKLCDDWKFEANPNDKHVSYRDIVRMKDFFRIYLVLFCAVWDDQLDGGLLVRYFEGQATFDELVEDLDFYQEHKDGLDVIHTLRELEKYYREHKLINLYGN